MKDSPSRALEVAQQIAAARKSALFATRDALRLRLDPRMIAADLAQRVLSAAIVRVTTAGLLPKKRKRAVIAAAVALAAAAFMRTSAKRRHAAAIAPKPLAGPTMPG